MIDTITFSDNTINSQSFPTIVFGSLEDTTSKPLFYTTDCLIEGLGNAAFTKRNEELLIEAIKNFIRKENLNDLNESLESDEITEDEFNLELDKNFDKYAINLRGSKKPNDIFNIVHIVNKIGTELRNLSTSEVSEMFSIKEIDLLSNFKSQRTLLK